MGAIWKARMTKKGNKKKKNGSANMAVDVASPDDLVIDKSEAMDTSENVASGGSLRKMKKGRVMKRSNNMRKVKAVARAVSQNEKSLEKISKSESKALRTKIAKNLYD